MMDLHSIAEIIRSVPDYATGMGAQIYHYFHEHPGLIQQKLKLVEQGGLFKLGQDGLGAILKRAKSTVDNDSEKGMTGQDLDLIPADVGDSFIREAQYVQDERLQKLWASLLVSYVYNRRKGVEARKAFCYVLGQLTPFDAKCLETLYFVDSGVLQAEASQVNDIDSQPASSSNSSGNINYYAGKGILTFHLPKKAPLRPEDPRQKIPELSKPLSPDILASLGNLCRLGLVEPDRYIDGGTHPRVVFHTGFGVEFAQSVFLVP
ncbi:MAG: DUF4393 domain-containing protein [Aphanocapsa feldmannii 277cI]|nr:MAG: DUF4393 domain-containing protein [Aphanocapsa feldmannii 277cI]